MAVEAVVAAAAEVAAAVAAMAAVEATAAVAVAAAAAVVVGRGDGDRSPANVAAYTRRKPVGIKLTGSSCYTFAAA